MTENDHQQSWQGKHLNATVLHSTAGVATQIVIRAESGTILFDAGDGTLRDYIDSGRNPREIEGIFFTHGHFDHVGGLHSILGFLRMIERNREFRIFVPKDCTEVIEIVNSFNRSYPDSVPFPINVHECTDGETIGIAGMLVTAYPVMHCGSVGDGVIQDQIPAMGYRISCQGEDIAISGDTGNCPALKELVTDADLALVEATFPPEFNTNPEMLERVHLTEAVAREIGALAKKHILIHRIKMRKRP